MARSAEKGVGAGERTRTSDPRITNALLYQLSYPGLEGGYVNRPKAVGNGPLLSRLRQRRYCGHHHPGVLHRRSVGHLQLAQPQRVLDHKLAALEPALHETG